MKGDGLTAQERLRKDLKGRTSPVKLLSNIGNWPSAEWLKENNISSKGKTINQVFDEIKAKGFWEGEKQ